jgi:hypothetical protein
MTYFLKLQFVIIIFTVASCGQRKEKSEVRHDKQERLDTLNKNEVANLISKLHAIQSKDYDLEFTYQVQEIMEDSSQLISVIGNITDIVKKDSNYLLKINGLFSMNDCLFEISVPHEIFKKISNQFDPEDPLPKGCFIFKPTSVKSSSLLTIDSDVSDDETIENVVTRSTYDFNDHLLFLKGNLIDCYVYKRLPKDED